MKALRRILGVCLCVCLLQYPVGAEAFRHGEESPSGTKRVAITFDDGPHATYTAEILDILAEYNVHATFFVIGQNACEYPELVQREIEEGHEVGNHTLSHPDLNRIGREELLRQLQKTDSIIYTLTEKHPTLFRPPTGLCTETVRRAAGDMHYDLILWSVDTRDWSRHSSLQHIISEVKNNVRDGSVILFHDYTARTDHATSQALRQILPYLIQEGYTFCTVSELLRG